MRNTDSNEIQSGTSVGRSQRGSLGILRTAALIALVVGAAGSLVFMFRAGQHTPRFLLFLFIFWVLSPFGALLWAHTISKRWSTLTQATLYCVILIVTLGSLAIYGEWINVRPAGSANAFLFVAVPPVSLLLMIVVVPIVAFIASRRPH